MRRFSGFLGYQRNDRREMAGADLPHMKIRDLAARGRDRLPDLLPDFLAFGSGIKQHAAGVPDQAP